ncbi:MAG: S1 RNA-binding domain-containing protein [Minisyncoccia bacterium]
MDKVMMKKTNSYFVLKTNTIIEGKILEKKKRKVYVDLSPFGVGVIRGINYLEAKDLLKEIPEGETVKVEVLELENEKGFIELALKDSLRKDSWAKIRDFKEKNEAFNILIVEANSGGLLGKIDNLTGFLPTSQMSSEHYPKVADGDREQILEKLKEFVGKELTVKVLDFDPLVNKLIFSEKLIELEKNKDLIKDYKEGDIVDVIVTRVVNFGVFVRLKEKNVDGLVHISEITDSKDPQNIRDLVKENEEKRAKIVKIHNGRIFLSFKI